MKTWSPFVSSAVSVLVAVSTLAVVTWNPCDVRPRPATTLLALATNWNGVALAPSAPKCTSVSSEPTVPVKVVADAASLPVPCVSVAAVRPPSFTAPVRPVAPATSIGVSSVMVTCSSLAERPTVSPSKSTACTRPDRSNVCGPLWSIGASSVTFHDPSSLSRSVKTSVPAALPPV